MNAPMRFSDLPRVAQIMIAGACAAGIAALSWGFGAPVMRHPGAAAVYLALAFIVASKRITLHANVATLSLGFIVVLAALFTCGPTVGMAAAALSDVRERFSWERAGRETEAAFRRVTAAHRLREG